jgi:hypothetical protein
MDEWFKSHAWKACSGLKLTGVRIPVSPPEIKAPADAGVFIYKVRRTVLVHCSAGIRRVAHAGATAVCTSGRERKRTPRV